jgi:hypothetical protein
MKLKIFATAFLLISNAAIADLLPKDSPERAQLIAMGYSLKDYQTLTLATLGETAIAFEKNSERVAISRYFNRQKQLNKEEEFELLQIINDLNAEYSYQIRLSKTSVSVHLYRFGNHEPQTFASLVRLIDKAESIWDTKPRIYKLINN